MFFIMKNIESLLFYKLDLPVIKIITNLTRVTILISPHSIRLLTFFRFKAFIIPLL